MAVLGPEINEANYIAMALSKRVIFSVVLTLVKEANRIVIKVDNQDLKQQYQWNPEKFRNRLVLFREMLDDLLDDGILQKFGDPKKDPFWDPEAESKNAYPDKVKKDDKSKKKDDDKSKKEDDKSKKKEDDKSKKEDDKSKKEDDKSKKKEDDKKGAGKGDTKKVEQSACCTIY
jgi:hypothetical protein